MLHRQCLGSANTTPQARLVSAEPPVRAGTGVITDASQRCHSTPPDGEAAMDQQTQQGTAGRRRAVRGGAGVLVLAAAGALVLAGCSGQGDRTMSGAGSAVEPAPAATSAPKGDGGAGYSGAAPATGSVAQPQDASGSGGGSRLPEQMPAVTALSDRSIVRTASLTVRAKDVLVTSAKASALAEGLGGFVAGEKTQASPDEPDRSEAVLVLRVPADRLPALLSQLHGLGTLLSEDQSAQDVTGQVIDVAARISAQKASVARIRALLAKATTLGQVVQIEGELTSRQAALESLEGQAAALADQTTLATATLTVVGPKAVPPAKKHAPPAPTGFGAGLSKGWHAFSVAGTWVLTALGVLLPFLVLVAPFAVAGYVVARRRTKAVPAPSATEPPPATA
jgi:hypothetical protein